jgi:hypothetical protein
MPDPLMGFTLQSFLPPAQPYTVSGACCPHDVQSCPQRPTDETLCAAPKHLERTKQPYMWDPQNTPRLQGVAPRGNPLTVQQWFRPPRARSSPGSFPLQGIPPRRNERGLHRASPHVVCTKSASAPLTATPGCRFRRGWLVSLETADPPGVSRLVMGHDRAS